MADGARLVFDSGDIGVDASELAKLLEAYAAKGRDLKDTMSAVAEMFVAEVNDKFEAGGPGWPPLAESTLRNRRGGGIGAQILKDTGRLAASIHPDFGADFAEASTDVSYAVYHVSSAPRHVIPLRDFFDLGDRVFQDAVDLILQELAS